MGYRYSSVNNKNAGIFGSFAGILCYPHVWGYSMQPLSPREYEIVGLIATGLSSRESAVAMGITFHTERSYRKTLFQKLGVHKASEILDKLDSIEHLDPVNRLSREDIILRRKCYALYKLALKIRFLVPQPCIVCGQKAQGYHEDYHRPLDVDWLCPRHHILRHMEHRKAGCLMESIT
jgi:DNA-binding CsgD family transcriptional regulator